MASRAAWRSIPFNANQIRLDIVLVSGQSFRWRETGDKEWTSVLKGKVWTLTQDDHNILYRVYEHQKNTTKSTKKNKKKYTVDAAVDISTSLTKDKCDSILRDYFQLDIDLVKLYSQWSDVDPYFCKVSKSFPGIRALRQDPVENLFSFICSSNNNISRITGMVEKLCTLYGEKVAEVDGVQYFSFPCVASLSGPKVEQTLRDEGFGYRAKFIQQSAKAIQEKGEDWLYGLRNVDYIEAHKALRELPGVGPKVADCVCLMSLDKTSAIPVDTHVWQITAKYYLQNLAKTKSLTDKLYKQIGEFYQNLFGEFAGWAQFVLFSADLKKFQNIQPSVEDELHEDHPSRKRPTSVEQEDKPEKKPKRNRSRPVASTKATVIQEKK